MSGPIQVPGFNQAVNWATLVLKLGNKGFLQNLVGPWRPPQWNTGIFSNQTQFYSVTVPAQVAGSSSKIVTELGPETPGATNTVASGSTSPVTYFFDAVLRADHRQELRHTDNPVQSGASVVDHAYLMPARISLEIGISDCMASYKQGQYTGSSSKSVSAFQTFLQLQASRVPLRLTTRLASYDNMLIESIGAVESYATKFSLRATIIFAQIIVANISTQTVSGRPDTTDTTNEGNKQPLPPDVINLLNAFPFPK